MQLRLVLDKVCYEPEAIPIVIALAALKNILPPAWAPVDSANDSARGLIDHPPTPRFLALISYFLEEYVLLDGF